MTDEVVSEPRDDALNALDTDTPLVSPRSTRRPRRAGTARRGLLAWLVVVPFFAYAAFFMAVPVVALIIKTFQTPDGSVTLSQVRALFHGQYRLAFVSSIEVSVTSAVIGTLFGLFVAYAAVHGRGPRWIQPVLSTFCGVASNFAGIPLAFAFIATLGPTGVLTLLLNHSGFHIYDHGFTLFSLLGLSLVYVYFQLPLMILVIAPALEGLRKEWREAAENLGATQSQYWWHVGLPVLLPSLAGALVLLFGNAFSAYATPYALASGGITLVPTLIGSLMSGNVVVPNPHLGDSLAFGMIVIVGITVLLYSLLQRRAAKWLR